jgi:hypothetical protein
LLWLWCCGVVDGVWYVVCRVCGVLRCRDRGTGTVEGIQGGEKLRASKQRAKSGREGKEGVVGRGPWVVELMHTRKTKPNEMGEAGGVGV